MNRPRRNPGLVDARVDLTEVRPEIFATLRKAVLAKTGVEITYASMSNPEYAKRVIFPHAIVRVGRRWHVRAWCAKRRSFRDFTLGRIRMVKSLQDRTPQESQDDKDWNSILTLEIRAHHKLSLEQQLVVCNEYFFGERSRLVTVRACLAQYFVQDGRIARGVTKFAEMRGCAAPKSHEGFQSALASARAIPPSISVHRLPQSARPVGCR